MKTTWQQQTIRGSLTQKKRDELPDSAFAFPAFANICAAADAYRIDVSESSWRKLGKLD
jgi:hypothetical protein